MTKGITNLGSMGGEEELVCKGHRISVWEDEQLFGDSVVAQQGERT